MYGTIADKRLTVADGKQAAAAAVGSNQHESERLGAGERLQVESRRQTRIYSHCHIQSADEDADGGSTAAANRNADKSARNRLILASIVCLLFMIGEIVGGILSNSLAIAADAAHLLTDLASFMISLFAIWLSSRPATRKMSFGWYRAEVIGALVSVLMIWLVTGFLVLVAIERLQTQKFNIDSEVMVITASAGLLVNIIMAVALNIGGGGHGHGHFHAHGGHPHKHDISNHSHLEHLEDDNEDERFDDEHNDDNEDDGYELDDDENDQGHLNEIDDEIEEQTIQRQQYHSVTIDCSMKETLTTKSTKPSLTVATLPACNSNKDQKKTKRKMRRKKQRCAGDLQAPKAKATNLNVRAAFIHVLGDFLQSLGVLIAALVIHFEPSYQIVDPICTFLFSFIVLVTTINIIRDATNVLMEGIPNGINFIEVHEKLQSLPNVIRVHNLRIWSLSLDKIAISTHLVIDTSKTTSSQALKRAIHTLKNSYNFFEVTIQIEEYREEMKDCEHCLDEDVVISIPNGSTNPTNEDYTHLSAMA